jgi:fructose-1-phosphate kinase PfkB-like protein
MEVGFRNIKQLQNQSIGKLVSNDAQVVLAGCFPKRLTRKIYHFFCGVEYFFSLTGGVIWANV